MQSLRDTPLDFGKYEGLTWGEVLSVNPSYIVWAFQSTSRLSGEDAESVELYESARSMLYGNDPGDYDLDDWGPDPASW